MVDSAVEPEGSAPENNSGDAIIMAGEAAVSLKAPRFCSSAAVLDACETIVIALHLHTKRRAQFRNAWVCSVLAVGRLAWPACAASFSSDSQ